MRRSRVRSPSAPPSFEQARYTRVGTQRMSGERDQQADLLQQAIDSCRQEYQELSSQWANLDSKAQGVNTVVGVFLAAIFAFIRELTAIAADLEKLLLSATSVLLILSSIFALLVLRLRAVVGAPCGAPLVGMIGDLVSAPDGTSPERLRNFAKEHARLWQIANESTSEAIANKAWRLQFAQWLLFAAIVCASAVAALKTWSVNNG
jgi:hypothetical protein